MAHRGSNDFDFGKILADQMQTIKNRRTNHNSGAVLIIMENRNFHPFAQFALDIKALRRLDIFKINTTKSWLQGGDDVN